MPRISFSEKYGFTSPRDSFQIDKIDNALKNRLWNLLKRYFIDALKTYNSGGYRANTNFRDQKFIVQVYDKFFKDSIEPLRFTQGGLKNDLKDRYFKLPWYEIYNLLEFLPEIYHSTNDDFYQQANQVLEDEKSGYRFIDKYITPIIDEVEIKEIEQAINSKYGGAKIHLSNALEHLSDRENPDYINSIKESISAVESVVNKISESTNVPLNRAINNIPFEIDSNFKGGITKMYSWTSSADGIRHGVTGDKINSAFAEAKYMLVICSAFINYLIEKQK